MHAQEAAFLIDFLEGHGLEVYVDGGWAVDALLGQQTRTSPFFRLCAGGETRREDYGQMRGPPRSTRSG
jgi:hypothetical protein